MSLYEAKKRGQKTEGRISSARKTAFREAKSRKEERERVRDAASFDLGSFGSDLASTSKSLYDYSSTWHSPEDMANAKQGFENMYNRIGSYIDYTKKYGINNPQEFDFEGLRDVYGSVLSGWDDLTFDYGNYKNADEYNKANKEAEERSNYLSSVSISDLQAQLDDVNKQKKEAKTQLSSADYNFKKLDNGRNKPKYGVSPEAHNEAKTAYDGAKNAYFDLEQNASTLQRDIVLAQRSQSLKALTEEAINARGNDPEAGTAIAQGKMLADKATKETSESWNPGTNSSMTSYTDNAKDTKQLIEFGTDAEKEAYYYFLGTGQTDKAKEYRDGLKESLNARKGRAWRKEADSYFEKLGVGAQAGLEQFVSGIEGALNFSGRYIPTKPSQYAAQEVRQQLTQDENYLGRLGFDVVNTGANMAPSIALGFANPIAGTAAMGVSAGGNEYQNMINQGYSQGQAYTMGVLTGASEALLQKAIGGIGALGGTSAKVANAVSSMRSGLAKFALRWGGSMASEGLEEAAQEILTPIFKSIATGEDVESVDWGEVAYSALLGGIMGGVEGGHIAADVASESMLGKSFKGAGGAEALFNAASLSPEASEAYEAYTRYANKGITAENASNAQIGNLYNLTNAEAVSGMNKAYTDMTKQKGIIEKQRGIRDSETASEAKKARASEKLDTAIPQYTDAQTRIGKYGESLSKLGEINRATAIKIWEEEQKKKNPKAKEIKKLSSGVETSAIKGTDKAVEIKGIKDKNTIVTSEGEVAIKDIEFSEKDAELYSYAKDFLEENNDVASLFVEKYDGTTDVEAYANDFARVIEYAKHSGFSPDYALKNAGSLSGETVDAIYQNTIYAEHRKAEEENNKLIAETASGASYRGFIDDTVFKTTKVSYNKLSNREKGAIQFLKVFASKTGMNLVFTADGGKYNGKFSAKDNTIYVDVYAGIDINSGHLEDTIIPTASHEITHWMEQKAPELYEKLKDKVFEALEKADPSLDRASRIANEVERLNKSNTKKKHTDEDAIHEIVARACEDMLSRSKVGQEIIDSMTGEEAKTFFGQLKKIITDLKKWITKLLKSYGTQTDEAKLLREYDKALDGVLDSISEVWDETLSRSIEVNQALEKANTFGHIENGISEEVQFSEKETFNDACDSMEHITDENYLQAKRDFPFIKVMDATPQIVLNAMKKGNNETSVINDRKIIIRRDALYLAIRESGVQEGHYHGLGAEALKNLPEYLSNPDAIIKTNQDDKRCLVMSHINAKNGQGIISVEFESMKDYDGHYDFYNVVITVFDLHENYIKKLFKKNGAEIKYKKEDLEQVNPQLYKWLRIFNSKSSVDSVPDSSKKSNDQNVNIDDDVQYSEKSVEEISKEDYKAMQNHFGTTGNYNVAGYMLTDGKILDFSGKHWGDTSSTFRQVDHRDIQEVLGDEENGVQSMVRMIGNGNIRLMPETGGINLAVKPSKNQRIVLRRYIEYMSHKEGIVVDIDEVGGDTIKSFEYDKGVSADRVMRDIDNYFKGGTQSELMRFHTMGDDVQFSDKNTSSVYDLMGESKRLAEENKKLAADVELLKERLKLEKTVTHGKYAKSSTLLNAASVILGKAQSNYSKVDLAKRIGDVYTYIASDPDVSAQGIFDRLYPIAEDVLAEAKAEVEVDYAIKGLLKDLKKTRISLDNAQIAEMEYRFGKDWRKRFFNKIIIAEDGIPLDSKWQEWAETIPAYFDADLNSADQIGALYDLIDTLKEASERVIEYDNAEQARWLADEIYNQFWNITPYESTADKYEKKISELKSKHKQMMTELRSKRDAREKEKLANRKEQYQEIYKKLKERKQKEVAYAKELGKQKLSEYKENAEKKTRIQRITANALALNEYLVKNSKDKHINEDLKGPVIQLLTAIDFSSKRMLEGGEPTKQDERLSKALSKVKEMFADASNGKEGLNDLYGHGLDEDIKKMIESVERIVDSLGGKNLTLNMMTLEDLQTLDKVMRTVKAAVNNVNKFHVAKHAEGIANLSRATMGYLNELGQTILHSGLRGKLDNLLNWNNALPYYVFKRYGVGGRVIFRALMDGQDKLAFNVKQIIDYAESTYTKDEIKKWDEEVKTFNIPVPKKKADSETEGQKSDDSAIEYQTIKMTVPQIMSLYCLAKRDQARKHLFAGGIRVADFETKKGGIVSQANKVIFAEEAVAQILDSLTERQKEVADKLQEFLNTVCSEWGNEVSMARFGYKAFGEKNYFPIQSEGNVIKSKVSDNENTLFRLLNMSFTKAIDDDANNKITVSNIFDVFAQHTSDMAKYNALALPVLDTFKWYNYSEKEELADGNHDVHSVRQSIETAFGEDGQSYLMTFLRDINGQQESDRESISKEFMRNFKIASVGMNLRVAALQPTSYLRAGAVIDNKYLVKAFAFKDKARGRAIDMAKKYCGIALWKSMGYYDTNIQRGVESQIKHDETWKDKAVEKSMYLAQKADEMTWGVLWNACELEIRDKRKDLEVGSEEFYETIGKRLREVIYATQVVDSVMTRSQMMRSTKGLDQFFTNFASEPTLGYNMLYDAYMSMALETRRTGSAKKAWEKYGKKIQRLAVSYTLTCTVTAAIEVAFDAFRNDDDEEKNLLLAWLTNFLSNMSVTSKIPYIKELHSVIKGYRTSRSELAWAEDAWNAGNRIAKLAQGKGDFEKTLRACLKALSELTGLPGFGAYRDGYALIETIGDFIE